MGQSFQYDETGNTYYYVFLTFLLGVLVPSSSYFYNAVEEKVDPEKKKKYSSASAKDTVYYQACMEKAERLDKKNPWIKIRRRMLGALILLGWVLVAAVVQQIMQFDYEMANFDPYEILEVGLDATAKEIKKKYRELSLKYHPDKPTGNEKLFMKLTKAYESLTDPTAKYNWQHYGNPDGPQAMEFGIGLPAWIVEEKNSIWVLGLYTLVFMIGLPSVVYYWWSNSSKFSGEQVLLDTTQLYYYFFHKTPHMMLKRVLMVLAASLEFERGHNSAIVARTTDNAEIPPLMKSIPNLGINNKEKPLCFGYSVKARALLFAHLTRISLPMKTLHQDRLYIIKKCPFLIQEMVTCISQLILLAHAGRIGRLPSLDTIEYAMKLSPMIVQALWDKQSPLLQLPHIEEDMLKHFHARRRSIKTLQQLAEMKEDERRSMLRCLTDEQYRDMMRVLAQMPSLSISVTTEVVDDEAHHVVTAGAIVTVTLILVRTTLETVMTNTSNTPVAEDDQEEADDADMVKLSAPEGSDASSAVGSSKGDGNKNKKKTGSGDKAEGSSNKSNPKAYSSEGGAGSGPTSQDDDSATESEGNQRRKQMNNRTAADSGQSAAEDIEEDDEAEWERFQKKIHRREKLLDGKIRISHSVHCPFFTDDKQEFWWAYVADRKHHALVTPPNHVTALVDKEEVELKFTAPQKPGQYSFTVCLRSDSYLGMDYMEDIKLDVQDAWKPPTEHPQWEFEDEDEEEASKQVDSDDEYATDDDDDEEDCDEE